MTGQTALPDADLIAQLEQLEFVVRRLAVGRMRGERRSRRRGSGYEFADYRTYVQGDDLRFLDWNLYGRLERLFLKLFHEEEDLQVAIWLDASASMGFGEPSKFEFGRRLAAALAYVAMANYDRVVLEAHMDAAQRVSPPLRGRHDLRRAIEFLGALAPSGPTDLQEGLRAFRLRHRRPGMKIVISDFLDREGFEPGLKWLAGPTHTVVVLHVLSPEEIRPRILGDLTLVDSEDGQETEVSITPGLLRRYRENLQALCSGLRAWCRARGIAYFFVPSDTPLKRVILESMRMAGVLR